MSNEEKQIEEMAKDLCECYVDYGTDTIDVKATAEKLTAKGYRKASDVAREILQEVRQLLLNMVLANSMGKTYDLEGKFAELKKKYEGGT